MYINKIKRPVVAKGYKRVTVNARGCGFDFTRGNEIF